MRARGLSPRYSRRPRWAGGSPGPLHHRHGRGYRYLPRAGECGDPAGQKGGGVAAFGTACAGCPLVAQCTTSPAGRTITISAYEPQLARARAAQADPAWQADYSATRPKVERKIGHLMRRRHGGRRARVRGTAKVAADFSLLAAAVNLARLGMLGLRHTGRGWAAAAI